MGSTLWPTNGTYTSRQLRQAIGAFWGALSARPLGARSGVVVGTPTNTVSASGSTWTVGPHKGVLDVETTLIAGPYNYSIDAAVTGSLNAPHSTLDRIDLLSITMSDTSEGDGSISGPTVTYTAGTAASSPSAPATPAKNMPLATVRVPALGTGSPSVTWVAAAAVAAGGIIPVPGSSAYPSSPYKGQYIDDASQGLLRWDGASWVGGDTGWQPITVKAGQAGGTGDDAPRVRRIGDLVYLTGQIIKAGGWTGTYQSIATLPASKFAPMNETRLLSSGFTAGSYNGNIIRIVGDTDLTVAPIGNPSGTLYLTGLSYPAA